jgi:hypothetical protein
MTTLIAQIAKEAKVTEQEVGNVKQINNIVMFSLFGTSSEWWVKLTATGKVKKNSLRLETSY